ncbi:unnamed protein product [Caenorhabditis bovis]|uniref:Uncharacterized protein n=1 Tax=Caenorhabditis bovis TaxID=2654633 RepID=A0A8S1EWS0_9PELO|nr:unnamed protein product [Caenorhabditis bovis]CAB3407388.1 unnamed protein product [Caenorhabditis bovis]
MGSPTGESNTEKRPQDAEVSDFPNDDNADFDVNVLSAANGGGTNPSEFISSLLDVMAIKAFKKEEQRKPIVSLPSSLKSTKSAPIDKEVIEYIAEYLKVGFRVATNVFIETILLARVESAIKNQIYRKLWENKDKTEKLLMKLTKHRKAQIDDHQNTESPSNVSTFDDSISTVNESQNFGSQNPLRL